DSRVRPRARRPRDGDPARPVALTLRRGAARPRGGGSGGGVPLPGAGTPAARQARALARPDQRPPPRPFPEPVRRRGAEWPRHAGATAGTIDPGLNIVITGPRPRLR